MKLQDMLGEDIAQLVREAISSLSQEAALQEAHPAAAVPTEAVARQIEEETLEAIEGLGDEHAEAGKALLSSLKELSEEVEDVDYDAVVEELDKGGERVIREGVEALADQFMPQGLAPQTSAGSSDPLALSEQSKSSCVRSARHLFEQGSFSDAMRVFLLLCSLDPDDWDSWVGYGHSAHQCGDFDAALLAYYTATSLRPESPWPLVWAANSCEQKDDPGAARDLLERSLELARERAGQEEVEEEIPALIEEIEARLRAATQI